jgi:aspartokinase
LERTDITLQKQAEEDAVERANLVEKLALRTEEAAQHERNFQQMAELAPCGEQTNHALLDISLTLKRHDYLQL